MSFNLDYFNYGQTSQGLATQQDYQNQQYNSKGDSLSPTPTGAPITVDYNNDQRTPVDFKQQALQAQRDTMPAQNTDNKIIGQSGYAYDKIPDSRADRARQAAMAFAEGYFSHMGDASQAGAAGGLAAMNATAQHEGMLKRQTLIHDLESKGYNPIDIDKWIQTGNTQDLVTNKGSWTSDGKGYLHNTLTGEVKQVPGYQAPAEKLTHVDLGDSIGFVNQSGQVVNRVAKGSKPVSTATGSDSGIGLDDDEANSNDQTPEMQNGIYGVRDSKGNFKPLGQKEQSYWRDKAQAKANPNAMDANTQLVSDDLDHLESLSDDQIDKFTGHVISKSDEAQGAYAEYHGKDAQANLAASKRLSTQLGNAAISAAKASGASGINTEAELKRFTAGVPQVRYTSPEDYRQSLKEIRTYADNFKKDLMRNKGVTTPASAPASGGVTHRWNPETKRIEAVQ